MRVTGCEIIRTGQTKNALEPIQTDCLAALIVTAGHAEAPWQHGLDPAASDT